MNLGNDPADQLFKFTLEGTELALRISGKVAKYITLVWLTHSFYVFQFGQKFIYSFKNPILIFMVLIGVSFATAIEIYWLFAGLSKGINKIRCSRNQR